MHDQLEAKFGEFVACGPDPVQVRVPQLVSTPSDSIALKLLQRKGKMGALHASRSCTARRLEVTINQVPELRWLQHLPDIRGERRSTIRCLSAPLNESAYADHAALHADPLGCSQYVACYAT
ncbi:hypothetical protein KUTG_10084 [Kutzneria sp. 744]|nr:hypothetical protein KUTG_10084 [Kutzneria sp. 744]